MTARTIQKLFDLSGKTALVTGGGKGLGLAMARALAGQGTAVCLSGRHEDVLRDAGVDLDLFDPAKHEDGAPGGFHLVGCSTLKNADGEPVLQWVKTAKDRDAGKLEALLAAIRTLPEAAATSAYRDR